MKYFLIPAIAIFIFSCKHRSADPDDAYKSMMPDSLNVLKTGDSAVIYMSYPQGTAYYQYEFAEDSDRVILLHHTTNPGDPNEAGGGMSEEFYIKAIKPGMDTIKIIDHSGAAVKAAEDTTKRYRNYEMYFVKIDPQTP